MTPYRITAARDGDLFNGTIRAPDQDTAEAQALPLICEAFGLDSDDYADFFELAADLDGASVERDALPLYRDLADGLSDMIESGRLDRAAIPSDYAWLAALLASLPPRFAITPPTMTRTPNP